MTELTSRERVVRALNHCETDRIPIDIGGISTLTTLHRDAYRNLRDYLGFPDTPLRLTSMMSQAVHIEENIRRHFNSDCYPLYTTGPRPDLVINQESDGSQWYKDEFGVKWKMPSKGLYFDAVEHPLRDCSLEDIDKFKWPDPKEAWYLHNLEKEAREIYEQTDYALILSGPFYGGFYVPIQWWIGFEDFFIQLIANPKLICALMDKVVEYHIAQWDILLDTVGKYVQAVLLSDDLGAQQYPIMRPSMYRDYIKPAQAKVVNFIKSKADVKIVYHCDGAIREFLPDFIEIGFDALNPVQTTAAGMNDTAWLKETYGDKLCFWGGSCDGQLLSSLTVEEIRETVKRHVYDLAPGGGLILSSIHNVQRDVPPENIVALYEAINEFSHGFYSSNK